MDNSTPENDQPAASAETAGPGGAAAPWRISLVLPELRFSAQNGARLKRQVRDVLREALRQTSQQIQDGPIGFRIHVQYSTDGFTESMHADARTGRMLPPCTQSQISKLFIEAAEGVLVKDSRSVLQMLTTVGWGVTDGVQLTAWAVDLERKEGVQ